jgi:hypothetical protein
MRQWRRSDETSEGLAQTCVVRCAEFLLSRQVVAPAVVSSLEDLEGRPATRSGDARLESRRISAHQSDNRLFKVGVSTDVNVDSPGLDATIKARADLDRRLTVGSKIRRYLIGSRPYKLRRIIRYGLGRALEALYKRMRQGPRSPCRDIPWGHVAGVNYRKESASMYRCLDRGAIYENWLTTRWTPYPSQVGSDLYTSACAARVFQWMHERTGDVRWQHACDELRQYFAGFFDGVRQRIEFDHREFAYGPLLRAFGAELAAGFAGWTRYDPVNVFGLRLYNLGMSYKPTLANAFKLWLIAAVVRRNQSGEGLIADNFRGMCVRSADLTYHHYALAMLCLGNSRIGSRAIDATITRGIAFSLRQQLCTGEVAYYGRAANNVYHLAAFAAALVYGKRRLGMDVDDALGRALRRLAEFQETDGVWNTCMSGRPEHEMSGWHGSAVQYSALSALMLAEALELNGVLQPDSGPPIPTLTGKGGQSHCMLKSRSVGLALSCGGDKVRWGAGQYEVGYGGITALTFQGRNIWLGNEKIFDLAGTSILAADIQDQAADSTSRFERIERNAATILLGHGTQRRRYAYEVKADGYDVEVVGKRAIGYALPLKGTWSISAGGSTSIELQSGDDLVVSVISDEAVGADVVPVAHNTQGTGSLVRLTTDAPVNRLRVRFSTRNTAS